MSSYVKVLATYYAVAVLVSVIVTAWDKHAAIRNRRRVPESRLFLTALLGSAAAMYLTMRRIRHKTLHKRFMIGLPLIMALKVAATCLALWLIR